MPVELSIVESVTALETTVVEVILESASEPGPAGPGVPAGGTNNQVLTKQSATDYDTAWEDPTGGPGGGVTDADYLVGTAHVDLSAEIVVGTSPGGELGGTWAAPTVDATHSGSSHAGVQAAAEATAAGALTAHEADTTAVHGIANTANLYSVGGTDVAIADGGTGASTAAGARANLDLEAGTDFPDLATFNDHSARHENGGLDEISIAGLDGTPTELTNHLSDATDAHDASAISVADSGAFYTATDVEAVLAEIAPQLGGGSGESFQRDITQAGHGLAVGNVVRHNGTSYVKAQANSAANAEVVGIVAAVADVNNFTLHYGGRITGLSGLTAGNVYYLDDDTAGLLTATEPPDLGDVSKPLLMADSTTSGYFFNYRGAINVAAGGGGLFNAYALLSFEVNDGTGGGSFTSGSWVTRPLNTEVDPDGIVTLASNQFTLGAGTYLVVARASAMAVDHHRARVQNITDTATVIWGSECIATNSVAIIFDSWCEGRFTIAGTKTFELQHRCQSTRGTDDAMGNSEDWGGTAVYAAVEIWREA